MTQAELDQCGFALVIARTSIMQMHAIAIAFATTMPEFAGMAETLSVQAAAFEQVQERIRSGEIKSDERSN